MLVLTRKSNQSIMIGDDIEVSVLSVVGDKVRIGIQAPGAIPIYRTEIYLEINGGGGRAGQNGAGKKDSRKRLGAAIEDVLGGLSAGS